MLQPGSRLIGCSSLDASASRIRAGTASASARRSSLAAWRVLRWPSRPQGRATPRAAAGFVRDGEPDRPAVRQRSFALEEVLLGQRPPGADRIGARRSSRPHPRTNAGPAGDGRRSSLWRWAAARWPTRAGLRAGGPSHCADRREHSAAPPGTALAQKACAPQQKRPLWGRRANVHVVHKSITYIRRWRPA